MAYPIFNEKVPDAASQSIVEVTTSTRTNLAALRDQLVLFGVLPGWSAAAQAADGSPASDPARPDRWVWSRGDERLRLDLTYDADGRITAATGYYSADAGANWDLITDPQAPAGRLEIDYDAAGRVTGYHWT